jgi:hypothetical protein
MSVLINIPDLSRESFPFMFYRKIGIVSQQFDITFPLDYGFYYMLERVNARYNSENPQVPGTFAAPPRISFYRDGGGVASQLVPFDISLMSSPSDSGAAVDTAPGANPAYPFTVTPLNRSKGLNYLHRFRDIIHLVVSNISAVTIPGDPNGSVPSYLEIMLKGRYFPALEQTGWGL